MKLTSAPNMTTRYLAIGFLALLFSMPLIAQVASVPRLVSVEGEAEAKAQPDMAVIVVGVISEGKQASTVQTDNNERVRAVLAALTKAGIANKDVRTSTLSLEPMYNWLPEGRREFLKYQMRNTVTVTVRNLSSVSAVLGAVVDKGSNEIGGITFGLSNINDLRDSLRTAACTNAQSKARSMVQAVGAKLGKLHSLNESGGWNPPQPMYRAMAMDAKMESEPTVAAGEMVVRVVVNASFEIE